MRRAVSLLASKVRCSLVQNLKSEPFCAMCSYVSVEPEKLRFFNLEAIVLIKTQAKVKQCWNALKHVLTNLSKKCS